MTRTESPSPKRRGLLRAVSTLLTAALLAVGLSVAGNVATATPAQALCVTPALVGNWSNIDPATNHIVRADIQFFCSDVVTCDADTGICTRPPSYYRIRPFGACVPTACDWGWRNMTAMSDGWQRTQYVYSWATVDVWARTEAWYGRTYLRIWSNTDFTAADGRTDFARDEWFLR
ncbi:hypothetical protein ACFQY4_36115 [Catellatospora bangladeshensis]|uniref:Uncharacterized protein n=1 Tax=Catellatospora bangladeshensis TaxID=310355 RepID=A0A8J3JEC1_9ACTN|nr:hypothetical protein [Catellatospora bangladeshensis]GIF81059.1 hypothetical protein Cba03nite_24080 [Catellatospora bangladeshensis]